MALPLLGENVTQLVEEITGAEHLRDEQLSRLDEQIEDYAGPGYLGGNPDIYAAENHAHEFLSVTSAKVVFDNPRVRARSRRGGSFNDVATAIQHGLNRWVKDRMLRKVLARVWVDEAFSMGATMTSTEPRPGGYGQGPSIVHWPSVERISPRRYFCDGIASDHEDARFCGRRWVLPKSYLVSVANRGVDKGWNPAAVAALPTTKPDGKESARSPAAVQHTPDREECVGWETWVPEYREEGWPGPDEGYHGAIFTLARDSANAEQATMIRKPVPFYGPRTGPFTQFGAFIVPDRVYPLSPLQAVWGQTHDLNALANSMHRSAAAYKRLVLYDCRNPKLGEQLTTAEHDWVIPVEGFQKDQVEVIEIGGVTPEMLEQYGIYRERLDRISGMSQANRGQPDPNVSATADAIADASSDARLALLQRSFLDGTIDVLEKAAWYLYHEDRVVYPLGEEAGVAMGMAEPWFYGGMHQAGSGATFDDLELEIEPYSMERMTEGLAQARVLQTTQLVTQIAPLIPTMPWVDWGRVLKMIGDAINQPDLDKIINLQLAQLMGASLMGQASSPQLAGQAGAAGGGGPQPPGRGGMGRPAGGTPPAQRGIERKGPTKGQSRGAQQPAGRRY